MPLKKFIYFITKIWLLFFPKALRALPVIIYTLYLRFTNPQLWAVYKKVPGVLPLIDAYCIEQDFISAPKRSGIALEFGAYKGRSTVILSRVASTKSTKLFTFEWFRGLPKVGSQDVIFKEGEYGTTKEEFEKNLVKVGVPTAVRLINGDIRKTVTQIPQFFDYAFIDVDLYRITKIILQKLLSVARGGEIIDIHDNHSPGVRRAIKESINNRAVKVHVKTLPLTLITQIQVL